MQGRFAQDVWRGYGDGVAEKAALLAEAAALRAKAEVEAQAILSALRLAYAAAWASVIATYLAPGPKNQLLANLRKDEVYINEKLAGTRLQWARAGKRDDGAPYTWEMWFDFASDVADDIRTQATVNFEGFYYAGEALVATGRRLVQVMALLAQLGLTAAEAGLKIPWWVWAAGAGLFLYGRLR